MRKTRHERSDGLNSAVRRASFFEGELELRVGVCPQTCMVRPARRNQWMRFQPDMLQMGTGRTEMATSSNHLWAEIQPL